MAPVSENKNPVIVIGAGFCGLIALKILKENGIRAFCFEKTDNFGGLWRFREKDEEGIASVTKNTIINSSKEICAMSDFPPPRHYANYMHNVNILNYLEEYAKKFDIFSSVHYNHEVVRVSKAENFDDTGEWTVRIKRHTEKGAVEEDRRAAAVLICIGHHVYPNIPVFSGQSDFRGKFIHTHSYKDSSGFENRRVMVVGIGNSGMDAAVEISATAKQVYLSTRRGSWILQRIGPNGLPFDFASSRFSNFIDHHFPNYVNNQIEKQLNAKFDHELYNVKPKNRYRNQHPTMSDLLPCRIISGSVIIKSDVSHFTKDGVVFKGEENNMYPLDAVILATGYKYLFPFIDKDIIELDQNKAQMYLRIVPQAIASSHPTLAIIGLVQPLGSVFPVAEMQSRWIAKMFKGELNVPSKQEVRKEVEEFERQQSARFVASQRHTIEVEYLPYMDLLAKEVGCKPNMVKLFFTDPKLFRSILFGPVLSYQYRLEGQHTWSGARDAILTVADRMIAPFNTRADRSKIC